MIPKNVVGIAQVLAVVSKQLVDNEIPSGKHTKNY